MKNTFKVLGIIVLVTIVGFSLVSCKEDDGSKDSVITVGSTNGKITVTDSNLSSYSGKWILGMGGDASTMLFAANNISSNGTITAASISGNSATLKVWELTDEDTLSSYSGNDTVDFTFIVISKSSITIEEFEDFDFLDPYSWVLGMGTIEDIVFSGGIVSTSSFTYFNDL